MKILKSLEKLIPTQKALGVTVQVLLSLGLLAVIIWALVVYTPDLARHATGLLPRHTVSNVVHKTGLLPDPKGITHDGSGSPKLMDFQAPA